MRKPAGKPADSREKVGKAICERLEKGESLRSAAKAEGVDPATPLNWCEADANFAQRYARAREVGYKLLADEIIEISDEVEFEPVPGPNPDDEPRDVRVDATAVARNRLRVDTRKWMLSKMLPKVYGDRLELAGVVEVKKSAADLSDDELALIAAKREPKA